MLEEVLAKKTPKVGPILFIAIDGHGGSGKSTIADYLAKRLHAGVIHTDDFAGWDNPIDWWPLVIKNVFEPIAAGAKTLSYERSKWWPNHHPEPVASQAVTPIMILEGVSALRKEFYPYISLGIYVNTPREICLRRGIDRDLANDTGKSKEEIIAMWEKWSNDEDEYIKRDNPMSAADIIIDGTRPLEDQLHWR